MCIEASQGYQEARLYWKIRLIYRLIDKELRKASSELERMILRGVLMSVPIEQMARETCRNSEAIRVKFTSKLKPAIRNLAGYLPGQRLPWNDIPRIFQTLGYKRGVNLEQALKNISAPASYNSPITSSASSIIEKIETKLSLSEKEKEQHFSEITANLLEEEGDKFNNAQDYQEAINCYIIPLENNPFRWKSFTMKIAKIFYEAGLFRDAFQMSFFGLRYIQDKNHKAHLYGILGAIMGMIALETLDSYYLDQSASFLTKSAQRKDEVDCVSHFNLFEFCIRYDLELESEKYLKLAKIAFAEFKRNATNSVSNFRKANNRDQIIQIRDEIRKLIPGTAYGNFIEPLNNIETL